MVHALVGDAGTQLLCLLAALATLLTVAALPTLPARRAFFDRLADAALLAGLLASAGLAGAGGDARLGLATACLVGIVRLGFHFLAYIERFTGEDGH
jgi:hypothetical protein